MYLIDTNIFLEVLLERERSEECESFLGKVNLGKITAFMTLFCLHTIAIIVERLKGLDTYETFLNEITNFEDLLFYSTSPSEEIEICKISKETKLDFDDALHYFVAKKFDLKIVSFDKHFDGKDIERVEPRNIR